ncbi:helix-turn-helix transcriptional regulator [Acetivibrio sp. MSJd-27]|uniref:helix-turn-helix transcriptional regulator n=1 Tax=Acetivibrio sp. MSJd-27 TaxID=2841523 RepID=UPI001C0F67C5|nr:helix-turn-helix transcriptional regulator [Acetivibrio sp. MSJd-27]MBU5451400.1 helix-turn-helix transcriptional regulator [Acetivibrio sp. MSJd-27]
MKNNIKIFRKKQNMTQQKLSEISGVSRPYISLLESEKVKTIKLSTMESISKALEKNISEIFLTTSKP